MRHKDTEDLIFWVTRPQLPHRMGVMMPQSGAEEEWGHGCRYCLTPEVLTLRGCFPAPPRPAPSGSPDQHLHVNSRRVLHHPLHDSAHVPGLQGTEPVPRLHTLAQHLRYD